jgi:hypothetical protein
MIGLILTAPEVRGFLNGTLAELRRPVQDPPRHWSFWDGLDGSANRTGYTCVEPSSTGLFIWSMDHRNPEPARLIPFGGPGAVLFVQEAWMSWQQTCVNDPPYEPDHVCDEHCNQIYVAYEATPGKGYRPVPDRAAITWFDEGGKPDYWHARRLERPWRPAETMPAATSRLALRNRGVRAVLDGVWQWVVTVEVIKRTNGAPMPPAEVGQ